MKSTGKKTLYSILKGTNSHKSIKAKAEYLRAEETVPLKDILRYLFDTTLEFVFPKEDPPYEESTENNIENVLAANMRKLNVFIPNGGYDQVAMSRRELIFVQMLTQVHPDDAKLLLACNKKKSPFKGLTRKVVNEAFPGLLLDEQPEAENK